MSRDALDAAKDYSGGMDRAEKFPIQRFHCYRHGAGQNAQRMDQQGPRNNRRDQTNSADGSGITKKDTNEFTEAAGEMAETLGDGTAPAIVITTKAAEEAAPAIEKMGNEVATATGKVAELTSTSRTGAEVIEALRVKSLDAKSAIELMRLEVEASDGSMISANTTALTYLDTMTSVERCAGGLADYAVGSAARGRFVCAVRWGRCEPGC